MEILKAHQLNIMLFMSGMCGILAFLSLISGVLTPKRRRILTLLECAALTGDQCTITDIHITK